MCHDALATSRPWNTGKKWPLDLSEPELSARRLCTWLRSDQHVVGDRFGTDGDVERGTKGGMRGFAAIEAEDEFVEIGLQVYLARPVIDATGD